MKYQTGLKFLATNLVASC